MRETPEDVVALQDLLDRSYASAGPHLLRIHTVERRPSAQQIIERLTGMSLLVLATVTGDGRPITGPVDGIFYRGHFHFSSAPDSLKFRHIGMHPQVSATHAPAETFAVTVHGRAVEVDLKRPEHAGLRQTVLDIYVPRYGAEWEHEFLDAGPVFARIDPQRMFAMAIGAGP